MKTLLLFPFLITVTFAQSPMPNVAPRVSVSHSLAWDASTTPGVTYVVRRGIAPGKYDEMVNLPGLSYVWANAPASVANYYAVTSRDATGLESEYSNELRVLPTPRPTAPNLKTAVPVTVEIKRRRGFERGAYFANIRTISE